MKVLFLNPPTFKGFDASRVPSTKKIKEFWYPMWLSYAAALVRTEHEVKLIDASAENLSLDSVLRVCEKFHPQLIVVEATTPSLTKTLNVCELMAKNNEGSKIVLVGPHATALPRETLQMSGEVFGVVRGEYDFSILDLANTIDSKGSFEDILGLSWKKGDTIIDNPARPFAENLDEIPFVSSVYKDFLDLRSYSLPLVPHPYIQILSARGCPFHCTFCLWPQTIEGHSYRTRSVKNFVDEIEYIRQELPYIKEVFIDDSTFTVSKKRVKEVCDLINKRGIDISWSANTRGDVDYQTLKYMKNAGCHSLVVGYESGAQEILNRIKKGITLDQMKKFSKKCHDLGIMIHGAFIFGLPGESEETIRQTMNFVKQVKPDTIQFSVATPYPGTEFFEWCREMNLLTEETDLPLVDSRGRPLSVIKSAHSSIDLCKVCDRAYIEYALFPLYWINLVLNGFRNPRRLSRWLLSGARFVLRALL